MDNPDLDADVSGSAFEPPGSIEVKGSVVGSSIIVGNGNVVTVVCAAEISRRELLENNPYRGLDAFDERSHDLFFGRERIVRDLIVRMTRLVSRNREGVQPRLLAIMGPSGCGKSSIARAGLVPALASYSAGATELWGAQVIVTRPGYSPLDTLAGALARSATGEANPLPEKEDFAATLRAAIRKGTFDGVSSLVAEQLQQPGPVILLIDQFEEVYALSRTEDGAGAEVDGFIATLLEAATVRNGRVYLLLTLRSDFFGALARHQKLSSAVAGNHVIVPAMAVGDLRRAIERPAIARNHPLDRATIELILEQAEGEPAALPLVQFALQRIWDGETLPSLGGVVGALEGAADEIFQRLKQESAEHAGFAKSAFLQTVQLGDGPAHDTRRRALLADVVPDKMSGATCKSILDRFVDARLLTMGTETVDGPEWFELPHESLIRHWRRLRDWIDRERDDLRFHRRASEAARHWEQEGRPSGLLWRQPDLGRLNEFHTRTPDRLTRRELDFLVQSRRVLGRARRVRVGIAAFAVFAAMAFFIVLSAVERDNIVRLQAAQSRFLAFLSRRQAEQGNGMAAVLLARKALPIDLAHPDRPLVREAKIALQYALSVNRELHLLAASASVTAVAFSPDGTRILTGSADGNAELWDARDGTLRHTLVGQSMIRSIAFHPLKPPIALSLGDDGVAHIWDVDSGVELSSLRIDGGKLSTAVFSVDGTQIMTTASDGIVRLWDTGSGRPPRLLPPDGASPVNAAILSRDAARVMTQSDDGRVRLLDARDGREIWGSGGLGTPRAIGLSPDGTRVAALLPDGRLLTADVANASSLQIADITDNKSVHHAAFSPGLSIVAAVFDDGTLQLWDTRTRKPIGSPRTDAAGLFDKLVFSSSGAVLATTTTSKELGTNALPRPVRLWESRSGEPIATLQGHAKATSVVAVSPDGARAVTGSEDETARIWDARRIRDVMTFDGFRGPDADPGRAALGEMALGLPDDTPFAFSPDGKLLVAASQEHSAWLWDVARGTKLRQFSGYRAGLSTIAFNPAQPDQFAAGADDGALCVWEASHQVQPIVLNGFSRHIAALTYSTDGRLLVAASWDGFAQVWDTSTWTLTATLRGHDGPIFAAALTRDGRFAATGSADGTARVWETATGAMLQAIPIESKASVVALAFSTKGALVIGAQDESARIFDASEQALRDPRSPKMLHMLSHAGMVRSAGFNGTGDRLLTTAGDGLAYLWNADSGEQIRQLGRGKGAILSAMFLMGDQSVAITTEDGVVEISDAQTGLVIASFSGHRDRVTAAAFDPRAQLLATASDDHTVRLWPVPLDGRDLLDEAGRTATRQLSPDERLEFFLTDNGVPDP